MELFLLVVALVVLASWQYQVDQRRIHDDYEDWKNNRR
jgi:hypothetical protein